MLQIGAEHLTARQSSRLDAKPTAGDPDHEVRLAWQCYQKLRNIYHARPEHGRAVARLGRTLKQWKAAILAYFDTPAATDPTGTNTPTMP